MEQTEIFPIKIKTNLKVSQAIPYLERIATLDGLRIMFDKDMTKAYNKFLMILLICDQNKLKYYINRDFRIALNIYSQSIIQN